MPKIAMPVRSAMLDRLLASSRSIVQHDAAISEWALDAIAQISARIGSNPPVEAIANHMGLEIERYRRLSRITDTSTAISLDAYGTVIPRWLLRLVTLTPILHPRIGRRHTEAVTGRIHRHHRDSRRGDQPSHRATTACHGRPDQSDQVSRNQASLVCDGCSITCSNVIYVVSGWCLVVCRLYS